MAHKISKERIAQLNEVFKEYFTFVKVEKNGTIVVSLDCEPKLKDLIAALSIISALPDYSGDYWCTHDLGYYDSVEDKRLEFYTK